MGFRRVDEQTCEIKRMWTDPRRRRRGYARIILTTLERCAAEAGYSSIRLATGAAQPEAAEMYAAMGYRSRTVADPRPEVRQFVKVLHPG